MDNRFHSQCSTTVVKRAVLSTPQDVSLGLTMAFDVMPGEFLQILHTSQDHWLTISTIGVEHPKVVYNSLFDFLPNLAKAQIASLLCSKQEVIEAHMTHVKL